MKTANYVVRTIEGVVVTTDGGSQFIPGVESRIFTLEDGGFVKSVKQVERKYKMPVDTFISNAELVSEENVNGGDN